MLSKVSEEIRELSHQDEQHIRFQNMGNGNSMAVPSERLKMHLLRSNEWAARKFEVYCEVWRTQQKALSPAFLQDICKYGIRVLISARTSSVVSEFAMEQKRTHSHDPNWLRPVIEGFRRDMERLFTKWEHIAEIDAKGLEYLLAAASGKPAVDLAAREIIDTRVRTRTLEAKIACVEARIEMAERSLGGMLTKETPAYRRHSVEQTLGRLKEDKRDFRSKLDEWQIRLNAALRRAEEITHGGVALNFTPSVTLSSAPTYSAETGIRTSQQPVSAEHEQPTETVVKLSQKKAGVQIAYRSVLKRAIKALLIGDSKLKDLDICRDLDADGAVELPEEWIIRENRSFVSAYMNPRLKPRIHTAISKVRTDLRRTGIID
jgi:hypothetical protein